MPGVLPIGLQNFVYRIQPGVREQEHFQGARKVEAGEGHDGHAISGIPVRDPFFEKGLA